jgi:integrase/recombinase XerD
MEGNDVPAEQLSFLPTVRAEPASGPAAGLTARSPLHRALKAFHDHMVEQDLSPNTIKAFDSDLRLLARYLGPRTVIGPIGSTELEGFLKYLRYDRGVPCKMKSWARRLTTLKVFFAWLTDEKVIAKDPAASIVHHRVTTPLPQVLSDAEVTQLLTATNLWRHDGQKPDARPHLLVTLLLSTGIKKSECMNLALTDIHAESATPALLVRYESIRQRFKERKLRLAPEFPAILSEYLQQYKPNDKLFPCTARNLEYVLDEASRRAELPPRRMSFEALRYTCAVRDLREGMDEDVLRRKLGLSHITWADTLEKLKKLTAPAL